MLSEAPPVSNAGTRIQANSSEFKRIQANSSEFKQIVHVVHKYMIIILYSANFLRASRGRVLYRINICNMCNITYEMNLRIPLI